MTLYRLFDTADEDWVGTFDSIEEAQMFQSTEPGWDADTVKIQEREYSPWVDSQT